MRHTALCLAPGIACTQAILRDLRLCGFTAEEIAVIAVAGHPGQADVAGMLMPPLPVIARRWCILVGVASGVGVGLGADALPGTGLAIAIGRGPLIAAIADAVVGRGAGGLDAALATLGFAGDEARWIVGVIRPGTALVAVTSTNRYEVEMIMQIYQEAGALGRTQASGPSGAAPEPPPPSGTPWAEVPQPAVLADRTRCPA